ncbi:MAG TPA: DUF1707 domain-containing protein [Acidimicrobiales bacterium]|nr:DUF1707 domain-containing protein [Acidimicrobiales bacterium]
MDPHRYGTGGGWRDSRRPSEGGPHRASDEDRDRATDFLRKATAQGYLTLDEFEERVGAVLTARYLEDLDPLLADIPGAPRPSAPAPMPVRLPVWQRVAFDRPVLRVLAGVVAAVLVVGVLAQLWFLGWPVFVFGFFFWKRGWHRSRRGPWGHQWNHHCGPGRPAEFI